MSIEWASGLFEGEGSITQDKRRPATYMLRVEMTDLDVLERFMEVVGCGSIHYNDAPSRHKIFNRKPSYIFRVCKRSDIKQLLERMLPFLGLRRAYTALNALDAIDEHQLKQQSL